MYAQRLALQRLAGSRLQNDPHMLPARALSMGERTNSEKPLQIMKFGGTSVADADGIRNVVKIIRRATFTNDVVVVVSAMAGVTNQLVEAASCAEAGDEGTFAKILTDLRAKHFSAVDTVIAPGERRAALTSRLENLFEYCEQLCSGTSLLRELTPRAKDAIWSLGERLSAPILAAALAESGVASEPVEAADVIVTDSRHGAADPLMDLTQQKCQTHLRPLLDRGVVPVTTGFIGATREGVLTILGRGGSDYSATIIGAALDANEVIIWTDVDGVLSADPGMVRSARTVPEMSYREAAEHAHFGAKVLHPKTLRALMQCDFPVWVRNAFSPERPGTKITPDGSAKHTGVKAITAISEISMIRVTGKGIASIPDALSRTFATAAAIRADILLASHSSSRNDICLVVRTADAAQTAEALRYEFVLDSADDEGHIQVNNDAAIVTIIGHDLHGQAGLVGRTFAALGRARVNVLASAQGSSACNISFVVARKDVQKALETTHREFSLGRTKSHERAPILPKPNR
jgi:aspartate kinase